MGLDGLDGWERAYPPPPSPTRLKTKPTQCFFKKTLEKSHQAKITHIYERPPPPPCIQHGDLVTASGVFGVIEQNKNWGNGPVVDQETYQHVYLLTDGLVGSPANFDRSELSGKRIAIVFI